MRHADLTLFYQGKNITNNISKDFLSFEYDENAAGDADSLSINLHNKNMKWMKSWFPASGDTLRAKLVSHDWNYPGEVNTLDCGEMAIDEPQFDGPPNKVSLKALSTPVSAGWSDTPGDYTWNSISLKQLGQYVAGKYGLKFIYDVSKEIVIKSLKRSGQTDADFLTSTAEKYNVSTKVYSNRLVLYEKSVYEARKPLATYTLGLSNISNYSLLAPTVGTGYNAAHEKYTADGKTIEYMFRIAPGGKVLELNESVDNLAQAEMTAKAKLREANEQQYSGSLTVALNLKLVAACTIMLVGFGKFDGKYFLDTCKHTYGDSAGQTQIDIHKVLTGGY